MPLDFLVLASDDDADENSLTDSIWKGDGEKGQKMRGLAVAVLYWAGEFGAARRAPPPDAATCAGCIQFASPDGPVLEVERLLTRTAT